jgi:bla regulator protein BlaR1
VAILFLALKSLFVAAATLILLRLMRARSASERSTVAHLGLVALLALPVAPFALPTIPLQFPTPVAMRLIEPRERIGLLSPYEPAHAASRDGAVRAPAPVRGLINLARAVARHLYLLPTLVLLALTLVALLRLVRLRARADVLVDPLWLTALARAQRRMDFKSGTALLTSRDLQSPVSWGLMSPTILLDEVAALAPEQAEAIIAHELAHVVHRDWVKLILARIVTALFWFNPLVWTLASEAHQLREEAADDAVIAAGVMGPDYAQLLVGMVRQQGRGVLLGAHGIAAPKNALHRRVQRVLDGGLARAPAGGLWVSGCAIGMLAMAGPLAAMALAVDQASQPTVRLVRHPSAALADHRAPPPSTEATPHLAMKASTSPSGRSAAPPIAPPGDIEPIDADDLVRMRAAGVTPDYKRAMGEAGFPDLTLNQLTGAHSSGVAPDYARAMLAVGMPVSFNDLMSARSMGLEPGYITAMRGLGIAGSFDDYRTLWSLKITPATVRGLQARGVIVGSPRQLLALHAAGVDREP